MIRRKSLYISIVWQCSSTLPMLDSIVANRYAHAAIHKKKIHKKKLVGMNLLKWESFFLVSASRAHQFFACAAPESHLIRMICKVWMNHVFLIFFFALHKASSKRTPIFFGGFSENQMKTFEKSEQAKKADWVACSNSCYLFFFFASVHSFASFTYA